MITYSLQSNNQILSLSDVKSVCDICVREMMVVVGINTYVVLVGRDLFGHYTSLTSCSFSLYSE